LGRTGSGLREISDSSITELSDREGIEELVITI